MAPLPLPHPLTYAISLLNLSLDPATITPGDTNTDTTLQARTNRPGSVKPSSLSAAILTVFCLLATFLALLVWWFFHIKGGFLWRPSDWSDYRSAILRRPDEISDDAITVFTDGSARRGAGGSSVGARTEVLSAVWNDEQKFEAADRMTSISRGGRDLWGEFKSRLGIGLRGGEAPPMDTWGGRSEAGGTSVSTRTRIGRHVPGRLPGICEVHHIGLDDYERASKKAEAMYKERMRQRERERRERLMAEQQGIPLQPTKPRSAPKKKKAVRRDWDNRSLETTTTLAAPALTATPVTGRRKDYDYESYTQEAPARVKGWKPGDSEVPEVSYGYNPSAYVKPKHLSHHMSTRTNRSYIPGDDPGDVPPPIRMKPKRQSMPPPTMKAEPVSLKKESTKKEKHSSHRGSTVQREKSHRHQGRPKEAGGKGYHASSSTKEVGGKGYVAANTKEVGRASAPSKHRSSKRQVSEKTESTLTSSSEDYTSSSEEYSETDSDEYTTDSDDDDEKTLKKPDLGTKVYHHPLAKRDVWNEVIAAGSSPGGNSGASSAAGSGVGSAGGSSRALVQSRGSGAGPSTPPSAPPSRSRRDSVAANAPPIPPPSRSRRDNAAANVSPVPPPPPPPGHSHTRQGSIVMERVQQFQSRASAGPLPPNPSIKALPGPGPSYSSSSGNRSNTGPAPPGNVKALGYRRNGN